MLAKQTGLTRSQVRTLQMILVVLYELRIHISSRFQNFGNSIPIIYMGFFKKKIYICARNRLDLFSFLLGVELVHKREGSAMETDGGRDVRGGNEGARKEHGIHGEDAKFG